MLKIDNLSTYYYSDEKIVKAVDDVSFTVNKGEMFGLAGPSGCGKSTIGLSIMRLIDLPGRIVSGSILFQGTDLLQLAPAQMISYRGAKLSMIFQDPFTSLNPVITIGEQISEAVRYHLNAGMEQARQRTLQWLSAVKIQDPEHCYRQYPHQLSGGMRQRAMIAMALCCGAELLIADEPTTALDVITQREIMELLSELNRSKGLSVLLISHNVPLIKKYCSRSLKMQDGTII